MTHRPIAPIAINGFEPGGTPRAYPIFEDVDPSTLLVDEGYQRDSSERSLKLVRKIVAGWDWAKFKAVDVEEPVLTSVGWRRHGDLMPGDKIFGPDGTPTKVVGKTPIFTDADCYRVKFCDGYSVIVSGDHLWTLEVPHRARVAGSAKETRTNFTSTTMPTHELKRQVDATSSAVARRYPRIAVALPVQLPSRHLPVDPYVLGVWLGDGSTGETRVTAGHQDVAEITANLQATGLTVKVRPQGMNFRLTIGDGKQGNRTSVMADALRQIGVYRDKHIPIDYLMAAEHQRFALLQGLMDTDGSCSNGRAIFCSAKESLAVSAHELVMSLGIRAQLARRVGIYKDEPRNFWQVQFFSNFLNPPFRLSRKAAAVKDSSSQAFKYRRVVSVDPINSRPVSCIRVDRDDGLYLVGKHLVTTHNSPVAVLTDAGLELIDGQHTAIAAATHPDIEKIPVMIVDVKQREDRASAFIGHNKDRVAVTAAQLHVAALAAGDVDAAAVERVCQEAGVIVLRAQPGAGRYKPGETISVAAISVLIRSRGEETAIKVMSTLARAGVAPITQIHIKAADLLLNVDEYSSQITADTLVSTIQAMALKIDAEASVFRAAHPATPAWKAVAICWFKNRRVGKGAISSSREPDSSSKTRNAAGAPSNPVEKINTAVSGHEKLQRKQGDSAAATRNCRGDLQTASGKLIENISHKPVNPLAISQQRAPVVDSGKIDGRPKLNGYVPGRFLLRCSGCDEKYQGDRKSRSCADCVYDCREAVSA